MDDLTPISKQLNNPGQLVPRSSGSITIGRKLQELSVPRWVETLAQIAQDKRHDLAPGILQFWKVKLQSYQDWEINDALLLYAGQFFPSVDDITADMNRSRIRRAEAKQEQTEAEAKQDRAAIERYMREHNGKTPSQVFCEENRDLIRKLDMNLVGGSAESPRNRKALEQAIVLGATGCESGSR